MKPPSCGWLCAVFVFIGAHSFISQTLSSKLPLSPTPNGQSGVKTDVDEDSTQSNEHEDITSKQITVSTNFPPSNNGQCQVEISVVGNGVKDKLTETCTDISADAVSTDDVFIFGDPKKCSFSLYSNARNTLYVIKTKICTKKTFTTTNGKTTIKSTQLSHDKCKDMKQTISNGLRRKNPKSLLTYSMSPAYDDTTPDLKQFSPTYPFPLNKSGIKSKYDITVVGHLDSFNVKGCYYYVTAKGNGINDHFQVSCSNENNNGISAGEFMVFGSPTSTLGLFTETPKTLIIMNKGMCYKKTYGSTHKGPSLMDGTECEEAKKRMLDRMNTDGKVFKGGLKFYGSLAVNIAPNDDLTNPKGYTKDIEDTKPEPAFVFNPALGVSWRDVVVTGVYCRTNSKREWDQPHHCYYLLGPDRGRSFASKSIRVQDIYDLRDRQFTITINKEGGGICSVEIFGKEINDIIKDQCSVFGENIKTFDKGNILVVADPTKQSGLYSDGWAKLVFLRDGQCYSKSYETDDDKKTKITTELMDSTQCTKVKNSMTSTIGESFGQDPGFLSSTTATWRPGEFQRVYSTGPPYVTITKNNNSPDGCTVTVSIVGRGINDELKDSCAVLGKNVMRKTTLYNMVIADPASNSGFFSDDWGSLVVIQSGQCFLRNYDSSPATQSTQITPSPMETSECVKVKGKISATLHVNFG